MSWQLRLVGTPALEDRGRITPLPFERRSQLLMVLALRGEWTQRAELAALLWPDVTQTLASTNLRKIIFRARDTGWGARLESEGTALRVTAAHDVALFHEHVREGDLARALALGRGELLAGFDDDANEPWTGWLRGQRERWRAAWRAAALERMAQAVEPAEGEDLARALLQADPLDEAAMHALLSHLAAQGQSARARDAYREFAQRMQHELGLAPGDALGALSQRLQLRPTPSAPPPAAPDDAGNDGYVGRVYEQRRIAELMARPDCRLLAIVGPGGIGKTRLARRALDRVAPLFADGAHFVPLEDLGGPSGLAARIACAVGVARPGPHGGIAALVEHLRGRTLLLVLDNFEALVAEGTPMLEELLAGVAGLKLIVTSRERLPSGAQWALPLDGLPCPEAEDADRLEAFDAARLFIAAARRADPAFDPREQRAGIVELCHQVDGLPLALELAAAWTRMMSCDQIARELREGSELLRATNPAFPQRQASVEAVFAQAWRHLNGRERDALARLSTFRGGFTVDAARAVVDTALPVLGTLVDKSLLHKEGARLGMHPLLQRFAARQLAEHGAAATTRAAHAEHFRRFVDGYGSGVRRGHAGALHAIDDEFENVCLSWAWTAAHGPAAALEPFARTLCDHATHRGQPARGLALLQQALLGPVAASDSDLQARIGVLAAHLTYRLDRFHDAGGLARRALSHAQADDRATQHRALQVIASSALRLGQLSAAREHYRAALDVAEGHEDRAATVDHLALVEKRLGHLDEALRLSQESLALHRQLDDPAGMALCLNNLASLHLIRREAAAAEAPLLEALALCERAGLASTQCLVLGNLCDVAMSRAAWDIAQDYGARAVEMGLATGQRFAAGFIQTYMAKVALGRGDVAAARGALAAASALGLELNAPSIKSAATLAFAEVLHAEGHGHAAVRALKLALRDASLGAGEHAHLRQRLDRLGASTDDVALPTTLDAMLDRVAGEAQTDHAALTSFLSA